MNPISHRRRIRFIDVSLQRWLVVGLITAEVAFVAGDVWILHGDLQSVLQEQLYRIHIAPAEARQAFRREILEHLGIFALANLVLLSIVESGWALRVARVVRRFNELIGRSRELDYSSDESGLIPHLVVQRALAWRARERERLVAIRWQCEAVAADLAAAPLGQAADASLARLIELLPAAEPTVQRPH